MRFRPRVRAVSYGVALLTGYLGVVVWLTWPLAASLRSSLPSEGYSYEATSFDLYYSTWVLAHECHALVDAGTSFADANIYHPAPDALFYGPAALGALPLFAPVFLATGNAVLAINMTFLLGIALTGVTMHVVLRRWTGSELAAVVGAATVIVNQWLIRGFVASTPHWAPLFWLPLIVFLAATRLDSMRAALVLALLVALQCLTDLVYVAVAVCGPLAILAVLRLTRRQTRATGLRVVVVLALAMLALAPVYRGYLALMSANPDLANQTRWKGTVNLRKILPDGLFHGTVPFLLTPVALGLVASGIAALVWRRRSGAKPPVHGGWAHGALWTVAGCGLALTPVVLIGEQEFLGPIGHLQAWFPSLQSVRVTGRLGVAGLVGLGILSGVAFAELTGLIRTRVRQRHVATCTSCGLAALVLLLVYRAYVDNYLRKGHSGPMPDAYQLQDAPSVPGSFLPILASERTPLIELPIGGNGHALAMFHSISHWRPLLNGYSSFWPVGFQKRMIDASRLPSRDSLDHLVESTGLALIWVHTQSLRPWQQAAWESPPRSVGKQYGLTLVAREGPELLFAVDPPPAAMPAGG